MITPLHITVMLGGPSAERDVSLRSGAAVAQALQQLGHFVEQLDPRNGTWKLSPKTDVVFLALHGTYGEDGAVQKELEELRVPYTGCDSVASAIAFDKILTKQRCLARGIVTAPFVEVDSASTPWLEGWKPPLVIKPVCQGSSVGLHFVERKEDWESALVDALRHDNRVLVEEKIVGRETTVGILDGQALPIVEVRPKQGVYDYRNKYTSGATEYLCPAPFDSEVTQRIQAAGLGAFQAVGGRDYGRIDIMVRAGGEPVILEVNTLPGMTETSLLPKAARAAGLEYAPLCQKMIDLAKRRATPNHVV